MNEIEQSILTDDRTQRLLLLDKQRKQPTQILLTKLSAIQSIIDDKAYCEVKSNKRISENILTFYENIQLIRPQHPGMIIWNFLLLIIAVYFLVQFPLLIGFGQQVWIDENIYFLPVLIIFYIILAIDIIITPLKMYYKDGLLVKDKQFLLKQYIKFHFWIDIIGLLAIVIPTILQSFFIVNILKIFFIPRIVTIYQLTETVKSILVFRTTSKTIFLIGKLVVFIYLVAHYLGIGFYIVDYYVYSTNYYGPPTPLWCWLYNAQAYSQMVLLLSWQGQYLYTMYFSIGVTTTIAYGDITPLNPLETFYMLFVLIINTIIFGYILSEVLRILLEAFYTKFQKKRQRFTIQNLLVNRNITQKLRVSIRSHIQQISIEQNFRNRMIQKQVIDSLPLNIKIDLYIKFYGNFLRELNIIPQNQGLIKNKNIKLSRFMEKLLFQMCETRYLAGDILYKEGEIYTEELKNHKAYYLKKSNQFNSIIFGIGKIPKVNLEDNEIIHAEDITYFNNQNILFGQIEFYTNENRSHWALSKSNILIYEISRVYLNTYLTIATKKEVQHIFELKQTMKNSICLICRESHSFKQCNKCHYVPNIYSILQSETEKQNIKRVQNFQIQNVRNKRRIVSMKTNALRNFKRLLSQRQRKNLHKKNKISMIVHSRYYRHMYQEDSSDTSSNTSSDSSEDLDFLISQTKLLIDNLQTVGKKQQFIQGSSMFWQQMDIYYNFEGYRTNENYEQIITKYNIRQQIKKSRRRTILLQRTSKIPDNKIRSPMIRSQN